MSESMLRLILIGSLLLAGIEGFAWWWMHPAFNSPDQAVLTYQPQYSSSKIQHSKSTIPLPEIYNKSAPMLRCSSGQTFLVTLDNDISVHCAFFEWDGTDTGSVLEAFRHMPEVCMGSIGMKLISKEKPRNYVVGRGGSPRPLAAIGAGSEDRETQDRRPEEDQAAVQGPSDSSIKNPQSKTPNQRSSSSSSDLGALAVRSSSLPHSESNIQHSAFAPHSLLFDHTVFRDPSHAALPGSFVHAFRAVWVAGLPDANPRAGLDGTRLENLRTIRLNSALHRYRPAHARVIQGAVRGALNGEAAWQAFQSAMLVNLRFAQEY